MAAQFVAATNQFLKSNAATSFGGLDNFTIMAWIKRNSSPGTTYEAFWGINHRAALFARYTANNPYMVSTATTNGPCSAATLAVSTWYHVLLKRDGTGASASSRMYLNGVDQGDLLAHNGDLIADDLITVARSFVTGPNFFDGLITDLAFFDVALSDADCAKPYSMLKSVYDLVHDGDFVDTPVAAYKLDQRTGASIVNGDSGLAQWELTAPANNLIVGGGAPGWVDDSPFPDPDTSRATFRPVGSRPYFGRPHYDRIWRPPLA